MLRHIVLAVVTLVAVHAPLSAQLESDQPVELRGVLQVGTFYGPPNFGDDPATDSLESSFYLQLLAELRVNEAAVPPDARPLPRWVYMIQLVPVTADSRTWQQLRDLVGSTVQLRGTLMAAHTGHHHSPVLLIVSEVVPQDVGR